MNPNDEKYAEALQRLLGNALGIENKPSSHCLI